MTGRIGLLILVITMASSWKNPWDEKCWSPGPEAEVLNLSVDEVGDLLIGEWVLFCSSHPSKEVERYSHNERRVKFLNKSVYVVYVEDEPQDTVNFLIRYRVSNGEKVISPDTSASSQLFERGRLRITKDQMALGDSRLDFPVYFYRRR